MYGLIFPGQGSQQVGMGKILFDNFKPVQELFEEASDTLNLDFKKLCFTDSDDKLNLTQNTQPALLLVSTAYYRVLEGLRELPITAFAGHSIGEYAACVSAGAISFSSALKSVERRGLWMQEAVPLGEGSMAALLGFTPEQSELVCKWAEAKTGLTPVSPANFNAPGQIVISGKAKLIEFIQGNLSKDTWSEISQEEAPRSMKVMPLKVSAPFHCNLMAPAQEKMSLLLNDTEFENSSAPIIQNKNAQAQTAAKNIRENLIQQISAPVLWTQCMDEMANLKPEFLIECGHGQVLAGLNKKMNHGLNVINFKNLDDIKTFEQKGSL